MLLKHLRFSCRVIIEGKFEVNSLVEDLRINVFLIRLLFSDLTKWSFELFAIYCLFNLVNIINMILVKLKLAEHPIDSVLDEFDRYFELVVMIFPEEGLVFILSFK